MYADNVLFSKNKVDERRLCFVPFLDILPKVRNVAVPFLLCLLHNRGPVANRCQFILKAVLCQICVAL